MPELPDPKSRPHPFRAPVGGARAHLFPAQPKPTAPSPVCLAPPLPYADLHTTSNFTFLTGASHPDELVEQAAALGHAAIAITDTNTLAGIVRAHIAAKEAGLQLIVGCRLVFRSPPGLSILVYPTDRPSYSRLCRLLTLGKRRAPKGECHLDLHDLLDHHDGLLAIALPPEDLTEDFLEVLRGLKSTFTTDRLSLAACRAYGPDDHTRLRQLADLSALTGIPLVATSNIHYHIPQRRPLQDVLTCIRLGCTIDQAGLSLLPHAEFHLKPPDEMARLFAAYPRAIQRTAEIARRTAGFSLDQLRYEYPEETCPPGKTPMQHLTDLTRQGAATRYPRGIPEKVRKQIDHELALIAELDYPRYFLTVHDLVVYARSLGILCQGRGAAANSAVCYCLTITSVDPDRIDVLFERFVSRERKEPPDIDIDFEHERREEVIQYLYQKYGRDRAALTAEVISYRGRSAIREVGKAMGLSLDCVDRLAKSQDWWEHGAVQAQRLRELGLNPEDATLQRTIAVTRQILGFPRHLSQHVGGFVITRTPLCDLVPIENAAMDDRTVIEWDKDDIDALGMLKVDVLGLGMLTAIRKAFDLVNERQSGRVAEWQSEEKRRAACADPDISRPDRVAERHGPNAGDLSLNGQNAQVGGLRPDKPDAPGRVLDPDEHRGGLREAHTPGVRTRPQDGDGIALRADDGLRTGDEHGNAAGEPGHDLEPPGRRPVAAIVDHEAGGQIKGRSIQETRTAAPLTPPASSSSLCHSATLPLCHCAPPPLELHTVPAEDPDVYKAICRADTVGVFQIESRAQMAMLPRLRPRCFYDLVIEVAIVRPGPIQGKMVHPYLRRRSGEEQVAYPKGDSDAVKKVLQKTLGVPLFQEQAMQLAIVAAGFTPDEADQLRRAMAAWKRKGDLIFRFGEKLIGGMIARGYGRDFAERCFEQIKGFSEYGFPESHAASFALLVYVSAWLKVHHPAAFAAALINSQPMGFYAPAQIVRDAQEHGVEVRPVDVNSSRWDCTLEPSAQPALRLGMRLVRGLREPEAVRIAEAVGRSGPFRTTESLWRASGVRAASLRHLAAADAFTSMGLDRQAALWQVRALRDDELPIFDQAEVQAAASPTSAAQANSQPTTLRETFAPPLPPIPAPRKVAHDYAAIGLSLKAHPISFIRDHLSAIKATPARDLADESRFPGGTPISVAGLVLVRQRPGTASGIVFFTLEDETGIANLVVRPHIYQRFRKDARHSVAILARGRIERQGMVVHIMTTRISTLDPLLRGINSASRDFR